MVAFVVEERKETFIASNPEVFLEGKMAVQFDIFCTIRQPTFGRLHGIPFVGSKGRFLSTYEFLRLLEGSEPSATPQSLYQSLNSFEETIQGHRATLSLVYVV